MDKLLCSPQAIVVACGVIGTGLAVSHYLLSNVNDGHVPYLVEDDVFYCSDGVALNVLRDDG
jgi:hypothetical protein